MKARRDSKWEVALGARDGMEGVRERDEEIEALMLGFVANVTGRGGAVDGGRGRGRYASAIANSNMANRSGSGWLTR